MSDFWEAYKDPRWQRKRLEVMQAAEFSCQECGEKEITLNVHHRHYRKGAKPWEYELDDLVCLCEPCHEVFHKECTELRALAGRLGSYDLGILLAYARGLTLQRNDLEYENDDTTFPITPDDERGMSDAYGLSRHGRGSWLTWHLYHGKQPFQVDHKLMKRFIEWEKAAYEFTPRTSVEEIDQLLVACSG